MTEICFAEVINGIVQRVIVADQAFIDTGAVGDPKNWVQTCPENSIRKNYAGIGYEYNDKIDAFVPPKPFESFVLDETTATYKAPIEQPKDGKQYQWDEKTTNWVASSLAVDNAAIGEEKIV